MAKKKPPLNPLYVKIGNRVRQARKMAGETNSRALSERLGKSGGWLNNIETGLSTLGVEDTLLLCKELKVNPCWISYGIGSPSPAATQANRYRNLLAIISEAESEGGLPDLLAALKLSAPALEKLRGSPYKKITDRQARLCEEYLKKPHGWLDVAHGASDYSALPKDEQKLLELHARLPKRDKGKLLTMIELWIDDPSQ